jgi:transposase
MNNEASKAKRPYFRPTTVQQRRLLFETYEATQDVRAACSKAHVGRGTFYYWWPRYQAGGYEALEQELSRAPHRTRIAPIAEAIVAEVIAYKQAQPEAGYRSVANAIRQAHQYQPVIGPTKVRQILLAAGLVKPQPAAAPRPEVQAVHAPEAKQTVNIDLCVVPISHEGSDEMVSTSVATAAKGVFSPSGQSSGG